MPNQYKNSATLQIPNWLQKTDHCANCYRETHMTIQTRKGTYYVCSDNCQENFKLQAGLKGYNQVRHHDNQVKPKLQTVGKLNEITAEELQNLYKFNNRLTRSAMNRQKQGDTLDRVLGMIDTRGKKSKGKVQTRMPFTLPDPELS